MKNILLTCIACLCCFKAIAQPLDFQNVDITTVTTNTTYSPGQILLTNSLTGAITTNTFLAIYTNHLNYGDAPATAFAKLNGNFSSLSNYLFTNSEASVSQTPWTSDINASNHALYNINEIGTLNPNELGLGQFFGGTNNWLVNNTADILDVILGGESDVIFGSDASGIFGGITNVIGGSGGVPSYNSYIIGGGSNHISLPFSGHVDDSMILNGWNIWVQSAGVTAIGSRWTTTFNITTNDILVVNEANGSAFNTNTSTGFAVQISGDLNVSGNIYTNGGLFAGGGGGGGTTYTNNGGNAGIIVGSGIGTNLPPLYTNTTAIFGNVSGYGIGTNQPSWLDANQATNDPLGNPLASLLASTNAAAGFQISNVANMFGLATNLSVFTYVTNVLSVTYVTNEDNVIATYTAVIQTILQNANTNTFTLYDAGTVAANGTYTWVPSVAAYTNTAAQFGCRLTGGFYIVFNNVGATLYSAFPGSVFNGTIFPSVWGNDGGVNPSPLGYFQTTSGPGITFTNTYRVIVTTGQTVDTGNNQFALSVNQKMTASGYYFNNVTLQSVFQGMMFPYLFVTNCAGTATNFQGPFGNTWLGFYTNTVNGTLLIPGGYVGSSIDGTNFSTSISLLCSNLTSLRQNLSYYSNTNVTGLYSVNFGHDAMATNQPLVSLYTPPISLTGFISTYSTNATLVAATTLTINFSPAMPDTSYIVTAPNDLVGATVTSRGTSSFVIAFTSTTFTGQTIEGAVIHK